MRRTDIHTSQQTRDTGRYLSRSNRVSEHSKAVRKRLTKEDEPESGDDEMDVRLSSHSVDPTADREENATENYG